MILFGDETFLCSLLGLQLSQLHLFLTQSLLSCCCTAFTGLQRALQLYLRTKNKIQLILEQTFLTTGMTVSFFRQNSILKQCFCFQVKAEEKFIWQMILNIVENKCSN